MKKKIEIFAAQVVLGLSLLLISTFWVAKNSARSSELRLSISEGELKVIIRENPIAGFSCTQESIDVWLDIGAIDTNKPKFYVWHKMKLSGGEVYTESSSELDDDAFIAKFPKNENLKRLIKKGIIELSFDDTTVFYIKERFDHEKFRKFVSSCISQPRSTLRPAPESQSEALAPALINDFQWSAKLSADRRLILTGYVPSRAEQVDVLEVAMEEFPAGVDDRTLIGTEALSGNWAATARWSLRLLSKLDTGEAALEGNRLKITGVAARPDIKTLIVTGARSIQNPFIGDATIVLRGEQPPLR